MSIRIHELAKRHNMEGKDMLTLLKERGYVSADTKSVSSTVSKIYEQEIDKEFGAKQPAKPVEAPAAPAPVAEPEVPKARVPTGAFVKSVQDIAREKEARAAAAKPAPAAPPLPTRTPVAPPPPRALVGAPVSAPRSPAPLPPPISRPSSPPPVAAPVSQPSSPPSIPTPAPVRAPAPPPLPPRAAPTAPLAPPPLPSASSPGAVTTPTGPAPAPAHTGDVKIIHLKPPIVVRDFATALGLKPFKLISELNQAGGFASMNSNIEEAIAVKVAEKHGFLLEIKHRGDPVAQAAAQKEKKEKQPAEDESKFLVTRPPVVVILGHVDHGKTSLLDAIRKANVAAGEAGGITQHIGAYQVEFNGRKITFLDTPGHAAFSKMRARGANVTDIAVLVVAADDGFMPQTDEALQHAQNAKVALIVAVNKMDVKGANLDQVKAQMQQRNIAPEDWGGETITVPDAAIKGQGIEQLLEMILLQADVLELKANPKADASGIIIESEIDFGRGPLATVIVQRGTLRVGDAIVSGATYARVRAMYDDKGDNLKEAGPGTPVRVIGWSGTPDSGATFKAVKNAREAEKLAEEEQFRLKQVTT
ncbi:MAG: infB, partial [Verrucomicrobia bacterium]|nr:infB [Verrucomicrobiota bacterium]